MSCMLGRPRKASSSAHRSGSYCCGTLLLPTWRCLVAAGEKKFSRSAASWAARSAQNARRVSHSGPSPSECATAFCTTIARTRAGCAVASRKPIGPP